MGSGREIERKFRVMWEKIPKDIRDKINRHEYHQLSIKQGHLAIGDDGLEVRVRQAGLSYFLTIKKGTGKVRQECEFVIELYEFVQLWKMAEEQGLIVRKTRSKIEYGKNTIELDAYKGRLAGLFTAEVEFDSEEASDSFVAPEWFGPEVTDDPCYKNQNLARYGLPKAKVEYQLTTGIELAVAQIQQKSTEAGVVIVGVAGGSASGKTSAVADRLAKIFQDDAVMISMDDYYRGGHCMAANPEIHLDQPEALNLELLRSHLEALRRGEVVEKPIYDFITCLTDQRETVGPKKVVIIEGLFTLHSTLRDVIDVGIFVDIGVHGRFLRRLFRDAVLRTMFTPSEVVEYFCRIVEPSHNAYVQSSKETADIVISNEYNPLIEAERAGSNEAQIKFQIGPDFALPSELYGIDPTLVQQTDLYFDIRSQVAPADETIRIRTSGDKVTMTYKGPRWQQDELRRRPKMDVALSKEGGDLLQGLYNSKP